MRDAAPAVPAAAAPTSRVPDPPSAAPAAAAPPAPNTQPLSLDSARARWPEVLDALRAAKKMLVAEALSEVEVAAVDGARVSLKPVTGNPMVPETIIGKRPLIEAAAAKVFGTAVTVMLYDASARPAAPEEQPRRLTVSGARAERMKVLRGKDPALDSAMDALDLELLE